MNIYHCIMGWLKRDGVAKLNDMLAIQDAKLEVESERFQKSLSDFSKAIRQNGKFNLNS